MAEKITQSDIDKELVSYVVKNVEEWEDYRDKNYKESWEEYYQQWRCIWSHKGQTRKSERSRFIAPALSQAIEMAVAEMEEATFNRKYWFDIDDDLEDQDKSDREPIRNQLIEDMSLARVPKAISEIYLNGAIYGTGIGKIVVSEINEAYKTPDGEELSLERVEVTLESVSPLEFAIDPSARNVNEGLGCAHIPVKSKVDIERKIEDEIYNDVDLGDFTDEEGVQALGEKRSTISGDRVEIIEYHGLVPSRLLIEIESEVDEDLADNDDIDMVEAIVTIANRTGLLKARVNPFIYRDRSIIAYQHDTVPNRFYGRGVAEKGIQSQRGLNAELRARQDGLALTIHPMIAADATRLPRGVKLEVGPGKQILTNGDPRSALMPFHFGDMSAHTYREAGEFERMLQMGTGSMDSATPIGASPRNQTASGMSMIASGSIKRSKRTMRNIEEDFLKPMINKFSWRYQQFDEKRYPFGDYKLLPYSTMGIMAREFEQAQLTNLLNAVPDGAAKGVLIKGIVENSSINVKNELEQAINQQFNAPPDPMQQKIQQLQLENAMLENEKLKRELPKIESETMENIANAQSKVGQTEVNRFNAISFVEENELDRTANGSKEAK